jgi:sulfatase maturation enzyme AslB (radical SAM superfamily)
VDLLEVILTASCNLRCGYCYQNEKKERRMSWDTLRAALDLLLASASREVSVLFLGGEPLLEFGLIRQAVAYVREVQDRRKRVRYSIITNGTLLGDEHLRFLARHRFDTQLSFDGVRAAQDLRGLRTFERLDALLARLARTHPAFLRERLTVAITITAGTLPHLASSVAYFLDKGVENLVVSPVATHDPGWKPERIAILEDEFANVFETCLAHYKQTGKVPFLGFRKGSGDAHHAPSGDAMCAAPSGKTLAVDVDGQIHGCAVFVESYQGFSNPFLRTAVESMRMGDFRAPDFAERLARYPAATRQLAIFHDKPKKHSSYGECHRCRFVDQCSICPASIGHIPGNTDPHRVPDFACAYNLVSLAYRERFPAQPTPMDILTGRVRAYGPMAAIQRKLAPRGALEAV